MLDKILKVLNELFEPINNCVGVCDLYQNSDCEGVIEAS